MRALEGQLAQLVEQRIENPRVRGSIPRLATKYTSVKTPIHVVGVFAFTRAKVRGPVYSQDSPRRRGEGATLFLTPASRFCNTPPAT